jgi:predicted methyltransferase
MAVRALRLDATEATANGTRLVRDALADQPRARAIRLAVPGRLPRARYDVVVVAELLYYLSPCAMRQVARDVAAVLRPGGVLVLAHHRIDFHDFAQHAEPLHRTFLAESGVAWRCRTVRRNRRWRVETCRRM